MWKVTYMNGTSILLQMKCPNLHRRIMAANLHPNMDAGGSGGQFTHFFVNNLMKHQCTKLFF